MLAELLEELAPRLLGGVADDAERARRQLLLADLGAVLRGGRDAGAAAPRKLDATLEELTGFEDELYQLLDGRPVPVAALRELARWFRARTDHAWRERGE